MMSLTFYPGAREVSAKLTALVSFLETLGFQKGQVGLGELSSLAETLTGKSPSLSQMQQLKGDLAISSTTLNGMLETKIRARKMESDAASRPEDLRTALEKEVALNRALDEVIYSGTSGKDCRAAEMWIQ